MTGRPGFDTWPSGGLFWLPSWERDGNAIAFDAATGKRLWHFQTGAAIYEAPTTHMLDGRQCVLVPSGTTLYAFALPPGAAAPARAPARRAPGR